MMDHKEYFVKILTQWNIFIDEDQLQMFERYYELLIDWNKKINLTAITDIGDVYVKHFADSISLLRYTDLSGSTFIDIGTGAGFPGIPLCIMCPSCRAVLVDSLKKRTDFLTEGITKLNLKNVSVIHGRAEDIAHDETYRESFDFAVSRAVANLSTLSEYCLPFVNNSGTFISYKSGNLEDELDHSNRAIDILGGSLEKVERFSIPFTEYERALVFIRKNNITDKRYPRKAGKPGKNPL